LDVNPGGAIDDDEEEEEDEEEEDDEDEGRGRSGEGTAMPARRTCLAWRTSVRRRSALISLSTSSAR
jgi:hypothetical protein